jgi:hypothetical protein
MKVEQRILDILRTSREPLKAGDIIVMSGLKKEEVDKAIIKLKNEDIIFSPKRCFYEVRNQSTSKIV